MTRVTYGVASCAFHSTWCLVEIGTRCQDEDFRNTIHNSFYVDEFLAGADMPEEAEKWKLHNELKQYGLELRKWSSSNSDVILSLPENLRETTEASKFMDKEYKIKTLRIKWTPNQDCFGFNVQLEDLSNKTKQRVLSDTSKLFDPKGWLAPVIIN